MTTQLPNLSRFELQCLRLLWNEDGATVRQVYERLDDPPTYSTVRKIFERLEDKGAVTRVSREGNAWVYRSAVKPSAMIRKEILRFLDSMFDGAAAPLLAHLAEMDTLSLADLREIERLAGEEIDERTTGESKEVDHKTPPPRRKDR